VVGCRRVVPAKNPYPSLANTTRVVGPNVRTVGPEVGTEEMLGIFERDGLLDGAEDTLGAAEG